MITNLPELKGRRGIGTVVAMGDDGQKQVAIIAENEAVLAEAFDRLVNSESCKMDPLRCQKVILVSVGALL